MLVSKCPICDSKVSEVTIRSAGVGEIRCPNCGTFHTSDEFAGMTLSGYSSADRALISGWVRERWRRREPNLVVFSGDINDAIQRLPRLKPPEKAERVLLLIEKLTTHFGALVPHSYLSAADAWAENPLELDTYRKWLSNKDWINLIGENAELTMDGWAEIQRIRQQGEALGNRAFIAMKYGDGPLDAIVAGHFGPACGQAGFELRRLDHKQPAGLIDDQLRVAIRTSKVLICDLTHGNKGAYWEAGFAEGLGKPVIFTCRHDVFDDKTHEHNPHFDTAHMKTIRWDPADPGVASAELKVTLRATFPNDAKMED